MTMVVTLLCISLALTVVSVLLFTAAVREGDSTQPPPEPRRPVDRSRFFDSDAPWFVADLASPVPRRSLLSQLEEYLRFEQAAAEAFHRWPSAESLHRRATGVTRY